MYCPKCGKEITEGTEFCVNCGTKVGGTPEPQTEGSAALAPEAAPVPKKKAGSKKKVWFIGAAALALMIAVGVGVYFLFFNGIRLEGIYYELYNGSETYTFTSDGKVTKQIRTELDHPYLGTYRTESDCIVIDWKDAGEEDEIYAVDGDHLVNLDFIYLQEKIPDGDTFDAVCSRSATAVHDARAFTFKKDGTFTLDDGLDISPGTYRRNGNTIDIKADGTTVTYTFYIYLDRLCSMVLYKG